MSNDVIPFGKYRGQPVEALAADQQYADWLAAQPWFRERYSNLYTIIINNLVKPEDTPEHNALQGMFLDEDFREAFVTYLAWDGLELSCQERIERLRREMVACKETIAKATEVIAAIDGDVPEWRKRHAENDIQSAQKSLFSLNRELNDNVALVSGDYLSYGILLKTFVEFETDGIDVKIRASWNVGQGNNAHWLHVWSAKVEIKPTIGDDYPTVLRQMKGSRSDTLFISAYTGTGISLEQFRALFLNENIKVVFSGQIRK